MTETYELKEARTPKVGSSQDPFATRPNSFADALSYDAPGVVSNNSDKQLANPELPASNTNDGLPMPATDPSDPPSHASSLPPMDGGTQAWLFLLGATMIEILLFGLPFSIGILHNYWANVLFKDQGAEATVTLAATLQSGLLYLMVACIGP